MASVSIGFFAFPAQHLGELAQIYEQYRKALYNMEDDFLVRDNELYRGAAAVALHHAELSGEDSLYEALAAVDEFFRDKAWHGVDQALFAPDEAQALARAVADLERRARSVTELVQRIARHSGRREAPETCRRVYDAFQETLTAATSQGAGFLWAAFWPEAEAELAEKRAREEQFAREQAEAEAAFQRLSPEEQAADRARREAERARAHAELEALIEERLLKRLDSERAEYEDIAHAWLCLLPAEDAQPLRAQLTAAHEHFEADAFDEASPLFDQARARVAERALEVIVLRKHGAARALQALDRRLRADEPAVHDPAGVYDPAGARALLDTLAQWEASGGEQGVIEALLEDTWMPQPLIAAAYRACKRALEQASTRPCTLFWWMNNGHSMLMLDGLPATDGL